MLPTIIVPAVTAVLDRAGRPSRSTIAERAVPHRAGSQSQAHCASVRVPAMAKLVATPVNHRRHLPVKLARR